MSLQDIVTFAFFLTSTVYFFYGLIVFSYNSNSTLHRLLFCSFLCLSWWAFCFTITNTAADYETALLWRRLASAGWGVYYSFFLHYILILTGNNALLQKYWLYMLLYLPAAMNVFLYGIYDQTAHISYHLVKTPAGWANIAGITALDMVHFLSYIVFSLAGIIILFHWGMTSKDLTNRKIALIIGSSALAALFIGTLTEHVINAVAQANFPQVGPIVILLPSLAMFYCIRHYGMMRQMPKKMVPEEKQILSEYARSRSYFLLALALFFGGFASFVALYLTHRTSLLEILALSSVFTIAGALIYLLRDLSIKPDLKETIIGGILAVSLPLLTALLVRYTQIYSWTIPMIFMQVAVIFSQQKMIALLGISALLSLTWVWVRTPVSQLAYSEADHAIRMVALALMISFMFFINRVFKQAIAESQHKAYHDSLTGLPNRLHFTDRLKQAINMAMRTGKLVGVLFIDIDSFKWANDALGHAGGDLLLKQIGQRIRDSVREYDLVARFGGDEFLIMVPQADDIAGIERVAAKVLENLNRPVAVIEQKFLVSVSMGIAVFPMDGDEPEDLIKNADIAMYASKEIGKNMYALCSAGMKNDAYVNITLINDLHWALERNELFLLYQPQIETASGEIIGVEALLRWRHPRLGTIAPSVFIPLAEKSGQISNIGSWTIKQASIQNKIWQKAGLKPISVAVNLSLGQFLDANLVKVVQNSLEKSGLSPEFLELEITESIAAYSIQNITNTVNGLKALGVRISIDDFGSGYSSFDRFKGLPVDKIKIDMRFIHGIGSGSKDEEIIKIILQLGKTLGTRVLAEGVEEERQLSFLRENYCDEIQGYYFYKPMDAGEIAKVLPKKR